ncbi:hypothetical protein FIBSPDRAFT_834310 [Athelia psychrophila]|uniref:Hydrophobin n=1 Tax=Athelia psychrophila TaxID=1759441 RepID=A0A166D1M9_9AGAM|nr:hypothetical protein FIBSPDRAFT_834310 [Fibularhizoctonia sp. CBS 109695]
MFFNTVVAALTAGLLTMCMASPVLVSRVTLCSGTYGNVQCCATDVLGVADLNCATPPTTPADVADFTSICAAIGQQAECCALPILGQALLCQEPI